MGGWMDGWVGVVLVWISVVCFIWRCVGGVCGENN